MITTVAFMNLAGKDGLLIYRTRDTNLRFHFVDALTERVEQCCHLHVHHIHHQFHLEMYSQESCVFSIQNIRGRNRDFLLALPVFAKHDASGRASRPMWMQEPTHEQLQKCTLAIASV